MPYADTINLPGMTMTCKSCSQFIIASHKFQKAFPLCNVAQWLEGSYSYTCNTKI